MKAFAFLVFFIGLFTLSYAQDDEAVVEELEKQRSAQQVQVNQIQESVEKIEETPKKLEENLRQLSEKALTIDDLMTEKYQKIIEDVLKNNPLKDLDRDVLRQMILARSAGQPVEKIFKFLPVTLEITVDMVKDDKAALGLIQLAKRKDDLLNFSGIWIVLVISFWMLKKRIAPKTAPFVRRLVFKTLLSLIGTTTSATIFYLMFKEEVGPTVSIILKNLL